VAQLLELTRHKTHKEPCAPRSFRYARHSYKSQDTRGKSAFYW